ncbi:hypothetical protein H310_03856 [Aphanomyces invadans]|uniref:CRAL-TRIO domain-containing protein n=1 Tax=Aphanomyces invadans TaxID=157072 RepID=A0A024UGC4_9STRA|nr:hypothetical protein H310_03856 [Aphanomyces invadans]ETW04698.1 hypothetical protein H310_03856 [Aphanomyces invadans]|eukprot:XP_008866136.1 hypothetical protein H310_03856 [Aphanomyces invadans]
MSVSATTGAAAAPPPRGSTPGTAIEGASSSGANGVAQTPAGVLKYGQTLRLLANSHYHPTSAEVEIGIGVYKKKGKHGILNAVPPLGDQQEHLFQEDEYRVLDPSGQHAEGSAVQFGHTLVLVNQDNLVWNNKTGGITGYVGPRPRQTNGEMYVSFHPNPKLPQPKSLFIRYGDEVVIDVEDANRHVRTYNKRLTNFKKPTSSILGGYICCDGKGHDLLCAVVPPRLQIKKVFVRGKTLTSYQFGQPIDISSDNATVEVQFTHDKKVVLTADKLNDMAVSGRVKHYVPLADGGPGGVQMTLQITTPSASTSDATSNAAPASSSLLESLTAKLRGAPVHQVSILVVISSVILALLKRSGLVHQWIAVGLAACIWFPAMLLLIASDKPKPLPSQQKQQQQQQHQQSLAQNGGRTLTLIQYVYHADAPFPDGHDHHEPVLPPVPERFLRATKGDESASLVRWKDTLQWRKEQHMDGILFEAMPYFRTIKENYPHYYHKRGLNNEPVYYEKPGKINLKKLRAEGITLDHLLRNSQMVTEFLWSVMEKDDNQKCISVLDVEGIGFSDFGGEVVEYVRRCAGYTGKHYPERCAYIFILNVPGWFNMVWKVVQGMIDEVTREKVTIVRGKDKIYEALAHRIAHENIPVEFGGGSTGESPEEAILFQLQDYNNKVEGATNPLVGDLVPRPFVATAAAPADQPTTKDV